MGNCASEYPEIHSLLEDFHAHLVKILGTRLVGLYLYGSLATGDFDPKRSDIDFLVVTDGLLRRQGVAELGELHAALWDEGWFWAEKLEGLYLPHAMLPRYEADGPALPAVNEGRFYLAPQGPDWVIQRHILREYECIVRGPSLRCGIEPIGEACLRQAVREILREWWRPMVEHPGRLHTPGYPSYAVLSMCRAAYTLQHGRVGSKNKAAKWARNEFDARWRGLIEHALGWEQGEPDGDVPQTIAFIGFILDQLAPE